MTGSAAADNVIRFPDPTLVEFEKTALRAVRSDILVQIADRRRQLALTGPELADLRLAPRTENRTAKPGRKRQVDAAQILRESHEYWGWEAILKRELRMPRTHARVEQYRRITQQLATIIPKVQTGRNGLGNRVLAGECIPEEVSKPGPTMEQLYSMVADSFTTRRLPVSALAYRLAAWFCDAKPVGSKTGGRDPESWAARAEAVRARVQRLSRARKISPR